MNEKDFENFYNIYSEFFNIYIVRNNQNLNKTIILDLNNFKISTYDLSLENCTSIISFGKNFLCNKIYDTTYAIISNRFDFLSKFDSQFKLLYSNKLNNSSNILNDICNENIYVVNNFKEICDFINFDRQFKLIERDMNYE